MVSSRLAITGTAAACAACCAPFVVPLVWPVLVTAGLAGAGGTASGWLAGLSLETLLCGGIAVVALAGGAVWLRQRRKQLRAPMTMVTEIAQCDLKTCGPAVEGKAAS